MERRLKIVMLALTLFAGISVNGCCRIRKALTGSAPCMEKKQLERGSDAEAGDTRSCGG